MMLRKCAVISGLVLTVFAIVGASTSADASCRCRRSCCSDGCYSSGYSGCNTCYTSCNTCYSGCNTCSTGWSGGCYTACAPACTTSCYSTCGTTYYAPGYYAAYPARTHVYVAGRSYYSAPAPAYAAPVAVPVRYVSTGNLLMPRVAR